MNHIIFLSAEHSSFKNKVYVHKSPLFLEFIAHGNRCESQMRQSSNYIMNVIETMMRRQPLYSHRKVKLSILLESNSKAIKAQLVLTIDTLEAPQLL